MRSEENMSATAPDAVPSQKGGECIRTKITFPASIRKNGNSFMITVRREYVEKMNLSDGDDVDVTISLPDANGEE